MKRLLFLTIPIIFCAIANYISYAEEKEYDQIFLSTNINERRDVDSFECSDRIYVVITGVKSKGSHLLEVYWHNPYGALQEYTRYDFKVTANPVSAAAWLELQSDTGGKVFGLNTGMSEFIGEWRAKVYLDGMLIGVKTFIVAC